jgi:hypothetical protein
MSHLPAARWEVLGFGTMRLCVAETLGFTYRLCSGGALRDSHPSPYLCALIQTAFDP